MDTVHNIHTDLARGLDALDETEEADDPSKHQT